MAKHLKHCFAFFRYLLSIKTLPPKKQNNRSPQKKQNKNPSKIIIIYIYILGKHENIKCRYSQGNYVETSNER